MNASLWVRFVAAAMCFAAWGALVLMGKAPANEFIFALGQTLIGLGVYHAATNNSIGSVAAIASTFEPVEPAVGPLPVAAVSTSAQTAVPPVPTVQAAAPAAVQ
ncbi:hypothetical protein B0G76_1373 [Paraburkholderia sp. BL23I1N1]|uniref:hypothetical protein n=1 Tax=Paraburkholderia sp. BL23I1N1 TaxID=1938802 RepID=UPI000FF3CA3A|nr:hypothetical protein [Paraburkholderia sp. BL23I1N1]RKE35310.1 hypothetical protein B0G76_1373 [Paraburkholderia sp. BL23I1N1]